MSEPPGNGWTPSLLKVYIDAKERADEKFERAQQEAEEKFEKERDRRYAEVDIEREKALKIKDEADKRALFLQAETQKYKDEKANELRSQIERERGNYSTKDDLSAAETRFATALRPIADYVTAQTGGAVERNTAKTDLTAIRGTIIGSAGVITAVVFGAIALLK
jgi:hypothetical protein